MVRRRERQEIHDEDEVVIAPRLRGGSLVGPAHDEPQHECDRQHAHRVDLLVHHRLVPHGERGGGDQRPGRGRSEEHTSELQSSNLVCRLLLEKKKKIGSTLTYSAHIRRGSARTVYY